MLAGEDFAEVAGEVSDAGTKANGGLIGPVVVEELDPVARVTALEKLKPGDISEPLRMPAATRSSSSRRAPRPSASRSRRCATRSRRRSTRSASTARQKKYIKKLRAQALIEWKDDNYRKMYEQALAERGQGRDLAHDAPRHEDRRGLRSIIPSRSRRWRA